MNTKVRVLMIGDAVGNPGLNFLAKHLPRLREKYKADFVVANGENSAPDGRGITPKSIAEFKSYGVNLITTGNHAFQKKEVYNYLSEHKDVLRPINFPTTCPGVGLAVMSSPHCSIGVINVQGRIFMREQLSCPFRAIESALTFLKTKTNIILIDIHAETTSEKMAIALQFDGQVSAVVGTHTHVQTADERVLPKGTAFITDLGMVGSLNSMIGMKKDPVIANLLTQMPSKFEVETSGPFVLSGVCIEIDVTTGKATGIERLRVVEE